MRVVGFGDLMLRLGPEGYLRFLQAERMEVHYTGAEANVCVALARFGEEARFVTRLPQNAISECAVSCLRKYGVNTDGVVYGGERMGVYFVEKGASQRPSMVVYDRKHTALCEAKREDFDWDTLLQNANFFHFTGITAALSEDMPGILLDALECARRKGVKVTCDLNYRKKLWSTRHAGQVMGLLLPYVDVLVANEEDADKVLGIRAPGSDVESGHLERDGYRSVAEQISARFGIRRVAITLQKSLSASDNLWSAMLWHDGEALFSREYAIHLVDRVGGGDSFAAGLIYGLGRNFDARRTLEFAVAASCLKQTIEMDFNLVSVAEVEALMSGAGSGRVQR